MTDWVKDEAANREKVKKKYGVLFQNVADILFKHDPAKINFEDNTDEYEPEAGTIIPRLKSCSNHTEARKVIHEEFIRWFYDGIGDESEYEEVAKEIWQDWLAHKSKPE